MKPLCLKFRLPRLSTSCRLHDCLARCDDSLLLSNRLIVIKLICYDPCPIFVLNKSSKRVFLSLTEKFSLRTLKCSLKLRKFASILLASVLRQGNRRSDNRLVIIRTDKRRRQLANSKQILYLTFACLTAWSALFLFLIFW